MREALSDADFVQENGPERTEFKMKLFEDMDAVTPVDSIIASSSSGITLSVMQSKCAHPERVLVGHPFNPPHVIRLVEVVGGVKTPRPFNARWRSMRRLGRSLCFLHKELPGRGQLRAPNTRHAALALDRRLEPHERRAHQCRVGRSQADPTNGSFARTRP
jgi:hypothetical protein